MRQMRRRSGTGEWITLRGQHSDVRPPDLCDYPRAEFEFWALACHHSTVGSGRPIMQGFTYATPVFSVSVLVVLTWMLAQKGDRISYGVPLGLAISLRLWPLLLLWPLLVYGRRRVATGAILTALVATVGGLAIVGFRLKDSVTGLITAGSYWRAYGDNGSLAGVLDRAGLGDEIVWVLSVAGALLLVLLPLRAGLDRSLACAVSAGIVLSRCRGRTTRWLLCRSAVQSGTHAGHDRCCLCRSVSS